ncbi:MAG: phosphatidylserine decarboxylase family protein [Candidatus Kapabacteria bacterium]|nr:phosphatidylserine decarboxylase family protein [Candidatus Kapabacteria bacterium]
MHRILTPYGYDNAFFLLAVSVALTVLGWTALEGVLSVLIGLVGVGLGIFTMWFFRDAERPLLKEAAADSSLVMAPADGQVVNVVPIEQDPLLGVPAVQISIFLSPVNLHVNRYPASGVIESVEYIPGKYLMAFNPKSSTENERSLFVMRTDHGRISYQQITGFLARRIVYDTKPGDVVRVGERFGMMKFGSRMDVVVPATSQILVRPGDRVVSSRHILAKLSTGGN